jgi:pimeloyl-ACP methyl ester carboxylesterase
VHTPLLVIQTTTRDAQSGKRGPLNPGQTTPWLELLKARLGNVKIEVLPGLGHFPQLEAPERVNRLIAEFCR